MYSHHSEHMQAEFDRIRRTIQWAIAHSDTLSEGEQSVPGTTPTLDSVGAHIRAISGDDDPGHSEQVATDALHSELAEMADQIEEDLAAARNAGVYLRLDNIRWAFNLSRAELDAVLLALAPAFDESVPGQYGELRDLDKPTYPTVSLLETLLVLMGHGRESAETTPPSVSLSPASPLFEYDILERYSEGPASPPTEDIVTVDDRIIQYLKGDDTLDPALDDVVTIERADRDRSELCFDEETTESLASIDERSEAADAPTIFYLWGEEGTGKDRLPAALTDASSPILRAEAEDIFQSESRLTRLIREAALRGASIHLEGVEAVTESEDTQAVDADEDDSGPITIEEDVETPSIDDVVERLDDAPGDVFLSHTESWTPDVDLAAHRLETCECPFPEHSVRKAIWDEYATEFADADLVDHIATNFRLPQRDIRRAIRTARYLCRTGADVEDVEDIDELAESNPDDVFAPVDGELTREQLYEACKRYSASNLEALAEQLDPGYSWDDIALNDRQESHIRELCGHLQYRGAVTNEWGFGEPGSRGDGVVALFYGQPGTGKTMAAEIIANETGLDLYRVDLSQIINKYIGETESRLATLLDEAERSNAILLFDEADAIFGKRAEVKDATDRYANTEINFLLQRLESFDGILLLTTNKRAGIDSAFKRRISHSIGFEKPQELIRRRFWKEVFPEKANVETESFDYEFLGRITTTPALIRKVAKYAAYIAATESHDGRPLDENAADLSDVRISFDHVLRALQYAREAGGAGFQVHFGEYEDRLREYESYGVERDWEEELERFQETDDDWEPTTLSVEESGSGESKSGKHSADQVDPGDGRSPEEVVEEFFSRLAEADESAHDLYHSNGIAETFSHRNLQLMKHGGLSIESTITRRKNDHDRVVLAFEQELSGSHVPEEIDGKQLPVRYELRPEPEGWRIFDITRQENVASTR